MDSVNTINRRTLLENDTLHILPTFLRVEEEMMSGLNESECGVIFGKRVFTFPQLIERIYEDVPNKESLLSYLGQLVLIEKVVDSLAGNLFGCEETPVAPMVETDHHTTSSIFPA